MNRHPLLRAIALAALIASPALAAPTGLTGLTGRPDAVVDLRTPDGAGLVGAAWSYADAAVVPVDFRLPGPDKKPSGAPVKTFDVIPHAGTPAFEAAPWKPVGPEALEVRRTPGKLAFGWYRLTFTIPERLGAFDTKGSTAVFEIVVDDYAEVWVDGAFPVVLGGGGPLDATIRGYNAPHRVVAVRGCAPGRKVTIAVFGINGPLSDVPSNYVWVRSATLDFYAPSRIAEAHAARVEVERLDPALDAIVPASPVIERLATGFVFTEGPVWHPAGYLLFSAPNENEIWRVTDDGDLSVYRTKSGYTGIDIAAYGQPGSNGLTLDAEGRLTIDEHGNRRVTRLERNGTLTVLASGYDGKRFNSPNDLVYRSDGSLYVTDPPFGLPKAFDDPRKELPYSGVYRIDKGKVDLVAHDLTGPNGIAFSPDERYLYVGDWDESKKIVMRYAVMADGGLGPGTVFYDMTAAPGEDAIDGIKVDAAGNLYVSGPGGLWVLSPEGKHLGTIRPPEHPHNLTFGGPDGKTLYLAAQSSIYRMRVGVAGIRPVPRND
jgi:gluconolactonase